MILKSSRNTMSDSTSKNPVRRLFSPSDILSGSTMRKPPKSVFFNISAQSKKNKEKANVYLNLVLCGHQRT